MKRFLTGFAALILSTSAWAGSVDYLSNQSADYLRTFSRNASLDADAAVYNPAGTAFLAPGLTLSFSNQSIWKVYQNRLELPSSLAAAVEPDTKTFQSDVPTLVLPNGQVIFKTGDLALFAASGIVGGGGTASYDEGVPTVILSSLSKLGHPLVTGSAATTATSVTVTDANLDSTSLYPQVTLGGAYAFGPLSLSAGVRVIKATKSFQGEATYSFTTAGAGTIPVSLALDATQEALGYGGIVGADLRVLPGLILTGRFETATPLEFTTTVHQGKDFGGLFTDGQKDQKDLPAVAALGARADLGPLTLTASGTGYLLGQSRDGTYLKNYEDFGWEAGASAELTVVPGFLALSAGGLMTVVGGNEKTYSDFDFSLDSKSAGAGLVLTPVKDLRLTLAASKTFYLDSEGLYVASLGVNTVTYHKEATTLAVACQYSFR